MTVPQRPTYSPFATAADNASHRADQQQAGRTRANGTPPGQRQEKPNMTKPPAQNRAADTNDLIARLATQSGHADDARQNGRPTAVASSIPGSDFATDEDIRAWCEAVRRTARTEATERAMDADVLESVLRTIPDTTGSRQGSRARARRVSRWAKKIAAADKAKQKYAATLYATFVREFETELAKVSAGRTKQPPRTTFQFGR